MPPPPSIPATTTSGPSATTAPPAIVLLSGGLDSATVLAIARRDGFACHTVSFDYGQRHKHELAAAETLSARMGAVSHRLVRIDLASLGGSALTCPDIPVPKDAIVDSSSPRLGQPGTDIPVTYVPARNLVFLSFATACAEVLGARDIFIGVNAVDYSGYPDCRPAFINAFERTANLATRAGVQEADAPLHIRAPLIHLSKADIIRLGHSLAVDYALTHSCYDPPPPQPPPPQDPTTARPSSPVTALACARCDACILRREGFRAAGIPDPTRYASPSPERAT